MAAKRKKRRFELMRETFTKDGRDVTPGIIDDLLSTHREGEVYPVIIGHSFAGVGFIPGAGSMFDLGKTDEGKLFADLILTEKGDESYESGEFPGWSLGIFKDKSSSQIESEQKWTIEHLALLGSAAPAIHGLKEITPSGEFSHIGKDVFCFSSQREDREIFYLSSVDLLKKDDTQQNFTKPENQKPNPSRFGEKADDMTPEELAAMKKENEELKAKNEKFAADAAKAKEDEDKRIAESFSARVEVVNTKLVELGASKEAREEFTKTIGEDKTSEAVLNSFESLIAEFKPKVKPGQEHTPEEESSQKFESKPGEIKAIS